MKQVIVMRHDLGMRRGKQIAQGAHASMMFLLHDGICAVVERWVELGMPKICVRVDSESELMEIKREAELKGLRVHLVIDQGRTEFHGEPTPTCLAIGPHGSAFIDPVTAHLRLL